MAKRKSKYKPKYRKSTAGKPKLFHGKPIIDATEDAVLVANEDDVRDGVPNNSEKCVGALAGLHSKGLLRKGKLPIAMSVNRGVTLAEYEDESVRYRTPGDLRTQTIRFDAGRKFDTGVFVLKAIPEKVRNSRGKAHTPPDRKHGAKDSPRAFGKRKRMHRIQGRREFRHTIETAT